MARPPRIQQAGTWYHIIARGIEKRVLFKHDRDHEHFLVLLGKLSERFACNISAYVLMPNHFHLFLQTMEPNLSRAVQWLMTAYAAWFNARYDRCGHLFQGRFKAVLVDPDEWAVKLTRYIHLNPVRIEGLGLGKKARAASRAGMPIEVDPPVAHERITQLRGFRWSSYRAYAGYERGSRWLEADWILARCGRSTGERRRWYRDYCEGAVRDNVKDSVAAHVLHQVCLGGREFLDEVLAKNGQSKRIGHRPGFEQLRKAIEEVRSEPWSAFASRHGDWGRDLALYPMRENGHRLKDAAKAAGIKRAPTAGMAIKRFEQRLRDDSTLRKTLGQVRELLK